ncbi:GAF domain-containing protein [Paenibacillus larvae subsp. larvae]|nr:GAF domain-containing protein [Paenibacillus larvae subsp. larvae]
MILMTDSMENRTECKERRGMRMNQPSQEQAFRHEACQKLLTLKGAWAVDVIALALYDRNRREIRWRIAYGASSEQYKAIAIRIGKGVAGTVLQTQRKLVVEAFPEEMPEDQMEYPIMMVERLRSAIVVPIKKDGEVYGVLLAGYRTRQSFTHDPVEACEQVAGEIAEASALYNLHGYTGEPLQEKQSSSLENYVQRLRRVETRITCQLLDQQVTKLADSIQIYLLEGLAQLFSELLEFQEDRIIVSMERKQGFLLSIDLMLNRKVQDPYYRLGWLIQRVQTLKGNVEMYNAPGEFYLVMNYHLGLLLEDPSWQVQAGESGKGNSFGGILPGE